MNSMMMELKVVILLPHYLEILVYLMKLNENLMRYQWVDAIDLKTGATESYFDHLVKFVETDEWDRDCVEEYVDFPKDYFIACL